MSTNEKSVKWANKYKILILNSHATKTQIVISKNVAIYPFSSGKILDVRQIAGVKDMTNIMSGCQWFGSSSSLLP